MDLECPLTRLWTELERSGEKFLGMSSALPGKKKTLITLNYGHLAGVQTLFVFVRGANDVFVFTNHRREPFE